MIILKRVIQKPSLSKYCPALKKSSHWPSWVQQWVRLPLFVFYQKCPFMSSKLPSFVIASKVLTQDIFDHLLSPAKYFWPFRTHAFPPDSITQKYQFCQVQYAFSSPPPKSQRFGEVLCKDQISAVEICNCLCDFNGFEI